MKLFGAYDTLTNKFYMTETKGKKTWNYKENKQINQ